MKLLGELDTLLTVLRPPDDLDPLLDVEERLDHLG